MSERRILELTRAGNPILREVMPRLSNEEIVSDGIQGLIADIRHTNQQKEYAVGLAAPQVGVCSSKPYWHKADTKSAKSGTI